MTTAIAVEESVRGPERSGGQGLDPQQHESGNRAIELLLTSQDGRAWTDFVATYRSEPDGHGAYEAWALRGMVRWTRHFAVAGGYEYRTVEVLGENPLEAQDPFALSTLAAELDAAGNPADIQHAYIESNRLTYPYAYERISQLFDSPNAPDLVVNSKSFAFGRQPGQHGNLDVVQSRSPLIFSGPGVLTGSLVETESRQVDIAPTIAQLMRFPLIDGHDSTGRTSTERGVAPDVYLKRQDGRVLDAVLDPSRGAPERVYILLLDGQSHTELLHRLESDSAAIPHLRRLVERGAMLRHGSITNFPSITWPSHNAIGTGAWCGHHDIVNPSYYLRELRQVISPQGQQFDTARCLGEGVETLFEAFHRVFGDWDGAHFGALTASIIEPCTRGADHASLENRIVGEKPDLIAITRETEHEINPRWKAELESMGHRMMGEIDNRGLAQARLLFTDPSHCKPKLVFQEFSAPDSAAHDYGPHHEGARAALDETDTRIGHILRTLEGEGLFESTLFVVTTDHGMATQDVSLNANATWIPQNHGMATVTTEPCLYLLDLHIEFEVSHDGRTVHVQVNANDPDTTGERPPVEGAGVSVATIEGAGLSNAQTSASGAAGLAVPAHLRPGEMVLTVEAAGYNPRHVRLDGLQLVADLRSVLYGQTG